MGSKFGAAGENSEGKKEKKLVLRSNAVEETVAVVAMIALTRFSEKDFEIWSSADLVAQRTVPGHIAIKREETQQAGASQADQAGLLLVAHIDIIQLSSEAKQRELSPSF